MRLIAFGGDERMRGALLAAGLVFSQLGATAVTTGS